MDATLGTAMLGQMMLAGVSPAAAPVGHLEGASSTTVHLEGSSAIQAPRD